MVKVFDTISDFNAYVLGGMIAGDLYYVKEDESVHFRTNNIDGSDTDYSMSAEGGVAPTPEPELEWETLSGNNLEMTIGTTYVFKTNVAGVCMWHLGIDTSGDGVIDNVDDASQSPLGKMVAGTEYYFTALNEYAGADDNTHSYMYFSGSTYDSETALPAGAVIQYAVVPAPADGE